jgi:2-pyrone-4,6-dicarboxylate lactonase
VIVQASCHSKDNRAMVDALESSAGRAKGVAFVGEEVSDEELKWLDRAGVKGVRFNFIKRLVDFTPRDVLQRIAPLGWHIVVYFEMPDLPELEPFFTSLPPAHRCASVDRSRSSNRSARSGRDCRREG